MYSYIKGKLSALLPYTVILKGRYAPNIFFRTIWVTLGQYFNVNRFPVDVYIYLLVAQTQ